MIDVNELGQRMADHVGTQFPARVYYTNGMVVIAVGPLLGPTECSAFFLGKEAGELSTDQAFALFLEKEQEYLAEDAA